ncbi:SHOCT domain-containing protein [Glycomyces sp. NEAU-S30]|uniref:SHOCT domain-containing protein n=1 Tax=Glycomyces niveus TaxID=2820287 RepID=A0ABS3U785_9ACTN|nr:SHOCT domain-containing protein [Glycomyces sp. NEAU-S30]
MSFWDVFWLLLIWLPLVMMWTFPLFDIFRRDDLKGWLKALWVVIVILLPFFGTLIYLIARPAGATTAEREAIDASSRAFVAKYAPDNTAAQLQVLAELHDRGKLTDDEFQAEKARLLEGSTPSQGCSAHQWKGGGSTSPALAAFAPWRRPLPDRQGPSSTPAAAGTAWSFRRSPTLPRGYSARHVGRLQDEVLDPFGFGQGASPRRSAALSAAASVRWIRDAASASTRERCAQEHRSRPRRTRRARALRCGPAVQGTCSRRVRSPDRRPTDRRGPREPARRSLPPSRGRHGGRPR